MVLTDYGNCYWSLAASVSFYGYVKNDMLALKTQKESFSWLVFEVEVLGMSLKYPQVIILSLCLCKTLLWGEEGRANGNPSDLAMFILAT